MWPEDLSLIRELMTQEEYEDLLRRLVSPSGMVETPRLQAKQSFV